jgi:Protein phosphatase 2C
MSNLMPDDPGAMGAVLVSGQAQPRLGWLRQAGELVVRTGCLQSGSTSLSMHTDFGPVGQDKEANQDYALAWLSSASHVEPEPFIALALADGLTSSYRSEWASELACAVALETLVRELTDPPAAEGQVRSPVDEARRAFTAAGRSLQGVAQALEAKPEASCPPGTFLSTWKYILRKGVLLQTTLTLAWLRGGLFHIAMLGDGGVLWRDRGTAPAAMDEVLAEADLSTNAVNALGPRTPEPSALDCWKERSWTGRLDCALYSDGVGRGSQQSNLRLLDQVSELQAQGSANPALECIRQIVQAGQPAFDDNLTLAILRRQ